MGCWNETCALTQLPILHGEEVVLFILAATDDRHVDLSNRIVSLYSPVGLPLYGTYDDYGSIDLDPTCEGYHNHVLKVLSADSDHEGDFASLLHEVERERFVVNGRKHNQMMVKLSAWRSIIDAVGSSRFFSYGDDARSCYQYYLDALHRAAAVARDLGISDDGHKYGQRWELQWSLDQIIDTELYRSASKRDILPFVNTEHATEEVLRGLADLFVTEQALSMLRKGWMPQFGTGSQSVELSLAQQLTQVTQQEIQRIKARYDE